MHGCIHDGFMERGKNHNRAVFGGGGGLLAVQRAWHCSTPSGLHFILHFSSMLLKWWWQQSSCCVSGSRGLRTAYTRLVIFTEKTSSFWHLLGHLLSFTDAVRNGDTCLLKLLIKERRGGAWTPLCVFSNICHWMEKCRPATEKLEAVLRREVARYSQIGQSSVAAVAGLDVENVTPCLNAPVDLSKSHMWCRCIIINQCNMSCLLLKKCKNDWFFFFFLERVGVEGILCVFARCLEGSAPHPWSHVDCQINTGSICAQDSP